MDYFSSDFCYLLFVIHYLLFGSEAQASYHWRRHADVRQMANGSLRCRLQLNLLAYARNTSPCPKFLRSA
jgi:hypothetical protein